MKKITLLLALSLGTLSLQAQNQYDFTTSQQTYADLMDPVSINNGQVWDWDTFSEITIPFDFKIGGQTVNRFLFDDDYFSFITPTGNYEANEGIYFFYPTAALLQDRTYSTGVSSSPISYKIEGETGSRILKLEIKNAGLENTTSLDLPEDEFYMNLQVWLYEADNVIEYRYGSHNIPNIGIIADAGSRILAAVEALDTKLYAIYGQSSQPTYNEFTMNTLPSSFDSDMPQANGTVYRLEPAEVAGLDNFSTSEVKLYPNPATSVLNIEGDNIEASEYTIYNVVGKLVAKNTITDSDNVQINISNLESGLYFVKINNQYLKFIKQ